MVSICYRDHEIEIFNFNINNHAQELTVTTM